MVLVHIVWISLNAIEHTYAYYEKNICSPTNYLLDVTPADLMMIECVITSSSIVIGKIVVAKYCRRLAFVCPSQDELGVQKNVQYNTHKGAIL